MKRKGLKLRNWLAVMMALCMAVGILAVPGGNVVVEAAEEGEFSYQIDNKSGLYITGYHGNDTEVIIPDEIDGNEVRWISCHAFSECSSLSSITIPGGVRNIDDRAFEGCSSLVSIMVDDTNERYTSQEGVLYNKDKTMLITYPAGKTDVNIPEGVTSIDSYAFNGCSKLSSITIPEGVTSIGDYAFNGCSNLSSITIPEGVTSIGWDAFNGCSSLSSIIIPESVTSIGNEAFNGCSSLNSITIPEGVTSVGNRTFYRCSSLSSIIIPESVTSIGDYAFYGCSSLNSITIPESVTSIDAEAFRSCSSLVSILVDNTNEKYTSQEGVLYNKEKTMLVICPEGKMDVNIPEGVTSIGDRAFKGCSKLSSITIPEGVTSIGDRAFEGCSRLSSITISEGVTSIGECAFWGCSINSITIPESVTNIGSDIKYGRSVFANCGSLTKITNNSTVIIPLSNIHHRDIAWGDPATGETITELGRGIAIAKQKPGFSILGKSNMELGDGAGFTDKNGNQIDYANVVICRTQIILPEQDIANAAGEVIKDAEDKSKVVYYDIAAYINEFGGEEAVLNGSITIRCPYQEGITKDYDIVVLHNTSRLGNVKKYEYYFTFETDGFSPFTVIALEAGKTSDGNEARDFVNRLYTLVLQRDASEDEIGSWTDALIDKRSNGVDAGYGFVFSDECKEKNLSNADFVEILYNTFMNRASDEGGKTAWVSQLNAGVEREKVFEGFIYSAEFSDICSKYGINVGSISDVGALVNALSHYRNQNADITKFVARCYTEAMGREYEPDGLEAWCKVIIEKSNTPKQVAQNFIFSEEFTLKNLSDEEYVQVLYRTFMGREADEGGLAAWVNVLESGREDRAKVLEGFSDSVEFDGILQSFGLN